MAKTFLPFLIGLGILAAVAASGQDKLAGGPFVVNVSQKSATIGWLVDEGEVTLTGAPGEAPKTVPALRARHTTITGLRPDATYKYSVPGHPEATGAFKTAGAAGTTSYEFVVYGDNRTRPDVHRSVIAAILKYASPDFIVQTGDMVADGADSALWPEFFEIEAPLLRKTAFYPSIGNHERNNSNYFDFFNARPYYSFTWGTSHFSVIDSDINNVSPGQVGRDAYWQEQTRWLEDDLAKSQNAEFRFVVAHHPPITAVSNRQGDNPHMTALMPMFEKYKVTAGLFGHDHNYQHYLKNGVHYIITGGGGAPLYDVDKPPAGITVKAMETENFVIVKVNGKSLTAHALKPNGESIDVTTISH
ncbi:MAG TPA: metallophosphoesterase [Bryobacteraceae bacterium]|nr:metallophosphoesterase [Bryobacteraceae bacterium]